MRDWKQVVHRIYATAKDATRTSSPERIQEFQELIRSILAFEPSVLEEIYADRSTISELLSLLAATKQDEALTSFLYHLEIPSQETELKQKVIDAVSNGDRTLAPKWITECDIINERLDTIEHVILPNIEKWRGEKKLFCTLKKVEAETLRANKFLLNPNNIYKTISNFKAGVDSEQWTNSNRLNSTGFRLCLPIVAFRNLLWLSLTATDYLLDLHEQLEPPEFFSTLSRLNNVAPVYSIITNLGYPMGGGESFMHQTCRILSECGVKCTWLSFSDPNGWYVASERFICNTPYYVDTRIPGGCTKESIREWTKEVNSTVLHSQGAINDLVMEIADEIRTTALVGYHFWDGLIELGKNRNRHILEHVNQHNLSAAAHKTSIHAHRYVASEFMRDVYAAVGGEGDLKVLHPISDPAHFSVDRNEIGDHVLHINVCELKGGGIFLECVRTLGEKIPFVGVQSEKDPSELPEELAKAVAQRPICKLLSYGDVKELYRTARMVIIPTLVDETFCRVAYEAALNGIPVISTKNGYLPYMLGRTGIYLDENAADWVRTIDELYLDVPRLKEIGDRQRARVRQLFDKGSFEFAETVLEVICNSSRRNLAFFTVWGDQGLGNQVHHYTNLLRRVGFKVHIFSFQPYAAVNKSLTTQIDPRNWSVPENADSVYYSFNDREHVTVAELEQFLKVNRVTSLIMPEVCWAVNWERLLAINIISNLSTCTIPNVETVLKTEVPLHNKLTRTLYNTHLVERTLTDAGVLNGYYIGHGFGPHLDEQKAATKRDQLLSRSRRIKYLHVAGHNPTTRKMTPKVIEAFTKALLVRDDIELTVTSIGRVSSYYSDPLPPGITVLSGGLSREEILDLYETHDVSIQVSSHEGLGLGFYESLSRGAPVISLNASPHNEVVLDRQTGWLISARAKPLPDNDQGLVCAWDFRLEDLVNKIVQLQHDEIARVMDTAREVYRKRFSETALTTRFLEVFPSPPTLPLEQPGSAVATAVPSQTSGWARRVMNSVRARLARLLRPPVRYVLARGRAFMLAEIGGEVREISESIRRQAHALPLLIEVRDAIRKIESTTMGNVAQIEHDLRFMKNRFATYSGPNAVLTYLRDESPIFVNTGDLGCPSPIINEGIWEPETLDVLFSFVKGDTVFLDVGANVGFFTIAIANRIKRAGRVLAFEPHPVVAGLLERSLHLNGLETMVSLLKCAVSDKNESLEIWYPDSHLGQGSSTRSVPGSTTRVTVDAHPLDELVPSELKVDLVKIDVEGSEPSVVRGMADIISRSPDIKIVFEKLESGTPEDETGSILRASGFVFYGIGAYSTLVPLDGAAYQNWTGNVLATREKLQLLSRTNFSIDPQQLFGNGERVATGVRYRSKEQEPLFFGPYWFLQRGNWNLTLYGQMGCAVRLVVLDESDLVLAELQLSDLIREGRFSVARDISHFSVQAYADPDCCIELQKIEFERASD